MLRTAKFLTLLSYVLAFVAVLAILFALTSRIFDGGFFRAAQAAVAIDAPPSFEPLSAPAGAGPPTPFVLREPPPEILAWGLLMLHRGQVKIIYYYQTEQVVEVCEGVGWTDYPDMGCFVPVDAIHCDIILNENLPAREKFFALEGLLAMCAYHWYGAERWAESP